MRSLLLAIFAAAASVLQAQAPWYEQGSYADLILQMETCQNLRGGFSSNVGNRYYLRNGISPISGCLPPSPVKFNNKYLLADNPEFLAADSAYMSTRSWPKPFYKYKALFLNYLAENSDISVNPILGLSAGPKSQWGNSYSQNTRGFEIRGHLNQKVGFYSRVLENQWFPQAYLKPMPDSTGALPGYGWWRHFNHNGYDFFSAKAYLNCSLIKNISSIAFGHDNFFIGNGYRSLILSNDAKEYLFLKINTNVGIFHYQNLFAQLSNFAPKPGNQDGDKLVPKKFMALHRLSVKATKWLELGASEMVIFDRDSADTKGFELEYLNPVIFYRAVESNLGSRDNALIALDWKANLPLHLIFYGQLVIDEFSIKQVKAKSGYWANKFGFQAGLKGSYFVGGNLLFLQAEFNRVTPYTYSHYRSSQSWSQYGQPLAHPLGANFRELVTRIVFQPARLPRLMLIGTTMFASKGMDIGYYTGVNYGGNIFRNYNTRRGDFGNELLQGQKAGILNTEWKLSYMAKHNLWLDLGWQYRKQTGWNATSASWLHLGLRLNLWNQDYLQ